MHIKSKITPLLLLICIVLFSTCKKKVVEAPNIHIDNPIIRLTYFYSGSFDGDPANMPNPHQVKQAISADGINFGDSKVVFSYDNLVDPDMFKIGAGQYGILVTDITRSKLVLGISSAPDGPFTLSGDLDKNSGQSCTITYNGVLKSYTTGISLYDLNVTAKTLSNAKFLLGVGAIGASSGILSDPSVAKMANGKYIMVFKYSQLGSNPNTHQTWMVTSSDPANFAGQPTTLIHNQAGVPSIVRVGTKLYVYFVDGSANRTKIGVGISADNGATWSFYDTNLNGQVFTTGVDPAAFPIDETNLN